MPNKPPFFSIITVVRNDLLGLQKTADSIINQKSADYEWIVIDGASTDGCATFLESKNTENFHWISEPDHGIYEAMNKGILRAKGVYLIFLNAADFFPDSNTLESVQNKLTSADQLVDVLFGGAILFLPSGKSIYRAPKEISSYIWHGLPSIHQATYYKSDLLKINCYDESYQISGDYYLISRLYTLGITSTLYNKPLVYFRVGDISFKEPLRLMIESHRVQRDVLKSGLGKRCLSFCKKIVAFTILFLSVKNLIPNSIIRTISINKNN